MIIYKATNLINGKIYIGQTRYSLKKRREQHIAWSKRGGDTFFCRALRKYGEENFKFEVVCEAPDLKTLNELEKFYIQKYDSIKNGYNMVAGGLSNTMDIPHIRRKHDNTMKSKQMREKMSHIMKEYRRKHPFTQEHKDKISKAMKGNHNFGDDHATRSVPCYCIVDGKEYHFPNYLEAGKWWYENYKPFTYTASNFQHAIKQSIREGYATRGRKPNKIVYDYIRWYKEEEVVK